jgi:hypothetical protein
LLEWFLRSLVPVVSKDIATSEVFSEEEVIMRVEQLELIYSQSGLLYDILPYVLRSILDKDKQKYGPHYDGIMGLAQRNSTDPLSNQFQQLSIQQMMASKTYGSTIPPTQTLNIHIMHSSNLKANQKHEGKKKQWNKKGKGDQISNNNVGWGKQRRESRSIHVTFSWRTI